MADASVDHGGEIPGADQAPLGDRPGQDLAWVQARELGGPQRTVQPLLLMTGLLRLGPGRERRLEQARYPCSRTGMVSVVHMACRTARWSASLSACRQAWAADCLAPSRPTMIWASTLTGLVDPGSSRSTWSGPPA